MSLMQVLTRDSLQSTTPYSFLGSSSNFIEDASTRENCTTDQDYISRDTRNISVSDASTTSHVDQHQQQAHVAQQLRREKMRINNQMSDMHSDLYNFSSGAELLAAAAGGGGLVYSGQGGGYGNQGGTMMSNKNWTGMNSYSSNSLGSHNGTAPATQNALPATLLVGSGLQYNPGSYNFGGSNANAQAEAMQQLYLMNAAAGGYATYPSSSDTGNMVFVSPSNNSQMGQLVGIPLHTSLPQNSLSQNSQVTSVSNSPVAYQGRGNSGGQQAFNSWRTGGDELLFMPASDATTSQRSPAAAAAAAAAGESYSNQEGNSIGLSNFSSDYEASIQQQPLMGNSGYQSLSLSLSSQQPQPLHYDVIQTSGLDSPAALSQDGKRSGSKLTGDLSHFRREASEYSKPQNPVDSATVGSSAMSASFNVISNSRYLKACQQLLDEVCSVGRGAKQIKTSKSWAGASPVGTSSPSTKSAGGTLPDQTSGPKDGNVSSVDGTAAVTTASTNEAAVSSAAIAVEVVTKVLTAEERQEYEAKKTKLLAMLQEVDRRYRQYYDQMQVVITSFDAVASIGAATPYTALALQAMSRYFRCLRDAITGQIQATCKALGEEDISRHLTNKSPTSRLRFVDQHLRQQRAFQQLGMLQQHAWRPQRGLPERSVSILRAWLFEHFLHPYPKDSDKMMLARQTGLTRNQVSNWFINARVRLWKPMVEEMYQEESRDQELDAAVSRLRAESDETGNYREANSDMNNSGDKPSKGGAAEQQCDSRPKADGNQDFVDSMAALASDNYPVNSSQIRKQHSDGQMFDEVQQQLKKSRFGNHNDMLQGLDVQMKSEMNDNGISESTHHHGLPNNGSLYGAYDSNRYASEFSSARYSATATGASTGVSLTLGLQHSDSLALAGARHAYLHGAGGTGSFEGVSRRDNVADHEYMNLYDSATAAAAAAGLGHIGGHESMNYATGRSHFVA